MSNNAHQAFKRAAQLRIENPKISGEEMAKVMRREGFVSQKTGQPYSPRSMGGMAIKGGAPKLRNRRKKTQPRKTKTTTLNTKTTTNFTAHWSGIKIACLKILDTETIALRKRHEMVRELLAGA